MALDDVSIALLRQLADSGARPIHTMPVADARAFAAGLRPGAAGPAMHHVEEWPLGEGRERCTLRLLAPSAEPRGVIVYYHGGGWVLSSNDDYDALARMLASETGCAVVLADYRLAPEHPFPSAVDDAWLALEWAHLLRLRYGAAQAPRKLPLIVAGDSAGGNLAAVVAQRAARTGQPELALQVLVYPVLQPDLDMPGYTDPANQTWMGRADIAWFWDHYLPDAARRGQPDASPLLAPDLAELAGLAPAHIVTAEHDVLRDEGEAYAARLRAAGVAVTGQRYAGQMHGFFSLIHLLPAARLCMDAVAAQINKTVGRHLDGAAPSPT